jgi:hypothetical protein
MNRSPGLTHCKIYDDDDEDDDDEGGGGGDDDDDDLNRDGFSLDM